MVSIRSRGCVLWGGKFLRNVGLPRANLQLQLKMLTYNLKRLCWLKNNGVVAF